MSPSLEVLIAELRKRITKRINTVEEEFIRIAGKRLSLIGNMTPDEAREYLFSGDSFLDQQSDLNKIKKTLFAAQKANIKTLDDLLEDLANAEGKDIER